MLEHADPETGITRHDIERTVGELSPAQRIAAARIVVAEHTWLRTCEGELDAFSASAIVQLYDALSEANRAKLARYCLPVMLHVTWGTLRKAEAS